eukprot:80590-Lingulodinium_polyedra.AAC.1
MTMTTMMMKLIWVCFQRVRHAATARLGGRLSRPRPRRSRSAGPPPSTAACRALGSQATSLPP